MLRRPRWETPTPDPRDQADTTYDNHIWYNKRGKVLGRSEREDSPLTRLGGKHNRNPIAKRDRSSYNVNPDWVNINHNPPSSNSGSGPVGLRRNSTKKFSSNSGHVNLRRNAIKKLKANAKLSKR